LAGKSGMIKAIAVFLLIISQASLTYVAQALTDSTTEESSVRLLTMLANNLGSSDW